MTLNDGHVTAHTKNQIVSRKVDERACPVQFTCSIKVSHQVHCSLEVIGANDSVYSHPFPHITLLDLTRESPLCQDQCALECNSGVAENHSLPPPGSPQYACGLGVCSHRYIK